ncbi:hypothetical protein [uncultured Mediterranean phage uvDeep-CGR0-AD1-C123]|nr:hypothetical protein [uncultured Mediterranean phage uvDeep-CGR0-AD1-C123]
MKIFKIDVERFKADWADKTLGLMEIAIRHGMKSIYTVHGHALKLGLSPRPAKRNRKELTEKQKQIIRSKWSDESYTLKSIIALAGLTYFQFHRHRSFVDELGERSYNSTAIKSHIPICAIWPEDMPDFEDYPGAAEESFNLVKALRIGQLGE